VLLLRQQKNISALNSERKQNLYLELCLLCKYPLKDVLGTLSFEFQALKISI
jgi:hypothetical protein